MADEKISAMADAGALGGTEIIPLVTGGLNKSTTPGGGLLTYFNANLSLAAARITSGQLALARGGTGADLSATGGANQIVRQNSAGGALTVSTLAAADIPNLDAAKITTGTLAVARGGTNIGSYAVGDLLYADGATSLAKLAGVATGNVLLSGGVATAPAWGKVDVTAHITGIVPSANGGTGVNNAGTLTNASNTTITGGGTLALAGFTLTVPATGTANLIGTAQTITAIKTNTITDAATNTTTVPVILGHNSSGTPAASFGVGLKMTLHSTTTTDQDAAQIEAIWISATHATRTSSLLFKTVNSGAALATVLTVNSDTSVITSKLQVGSGYLHTGTSGFLNSFGNFNTSSNTYGGWNTGASTFVSGYIHGWSSVAFGSNFSSATNDTGLARNAAGIVEVNNGTAGQWGSLKAGARDAGTTTITDGLTLGHQSTGTPAAGLGTAIQLNINSTTTADVNAVRETAEWVVATHASRTARYKLNVYDTASREVLRGEASGTAPMIGFLGSAAVAQQTSGANLTNNVTSGGTDDTIANFTDLTTYATDAATIRNDIYQLARKLKQVNDALRLYGLLT